MSEGLKRFLGSTIKAIEQTKREIEAEKEREERQLVIQKSMRRAELTERRQREDAERRKREASHKQAESALMIFLSKRQNVYDNLDKLKSGLYCARALNGK